MENSSKEYSYAKVKHMIERQKNRYGWEFIFLGANIDAISEASRFGIDAPYAANYHADSKGTALNYEVLGDAICELRACCTEKKLSARWKERIDEDYENKK